uniref:Uncharacterized protein n=1 Tax=Canis lupus dingo TaxID=286419 RepID=A0A8C0LEQ0_CANLU
WSGAEYDLSASTVCPNGRVFQVVFAVKAECHMVIGAVPLAKPGKLQKMNRKASDEKNDPL